MKYFLLITAVFYLLGCSKTVLHNPYQFKEDGTLNCELPYGDQITEDLEPFKKSGISPELVLKTYLQSPEKRLYVEIKNNQINIDYSKIEEGLLLSRSRQISRMLENVKQRFGVLPEAVFVINLLDELQMSKNSGLFPVFSFQRSEKYYDIAFPYPASFLGIDELISNMKANLILWENKKQGLVWRGSQTGGIYREDNWKTFPRSLLVLKCAEIPERCDAGFSNYTQVDENGQKSMQATIGLKQAILLESMQNWKYIASLDGNGWADRFVRLLASNSLIFKQDSENKEFFYGALEPYKHYLPIAHDLSDLRQQLDWADAHEKAVLEMISNANEFTSKHIGQAQTDCYVFNLIKEYGDVSTKARH